MGSIQHASYSLLQSALTAIRKGDSVMLGDDSRWCLDPVEPGISCKASVSSPVLVILSWPSVSATCDHQNSAGISSALWIILILPFNSFGSHISDAQGVTKNRGTQGLAHAQLLEPSCVIFWGFQGTLPAFLCQPSYTVQCSGMKCYIPV